LAQYPNLYVDYSWIIYDVIICPGGVPSPDWLALTEQYSARICLGSDLVTRFERMGRSYSATMSSWTRSARAPALTCAGARRRSCMGATKAGWRGQRQYRHQYGRACDNLRMDLRKDYQGRRKVHR
jgi:hypothetical protein